MNTNFEKVTGETVISFGKYKGKKLSEIPPKYLMWLIEKDFLTGQMKKYLQTNRELIKQAQYK